MHGYDSVEEFMKARVVEHYQDPHERERFLADLQRQGTLSNYELRLKRADGTPIYASVNATAHRGPSGDVDWIDGVVEDITERKRAQEALRSSEERYRTLAESSPEAIFILDRDIKVRYVNSTAAALWGRPPKDLIGLPQTELFPPEAAQYHSTIVTNVFETGNVVHREERLTCPVGDQWIEIRLAPLYDAQGTVTSVMCVCRDITERKRAEQQLAETLDLNQKMIAASSLGIAAYKASGECVFTNEALARTIGARLNEVLQANFRRVEVWRESGLLELSDEALRQGQARSGEIFCTTRFGKTVWLDCHLAPFVSNGQPHLLLMVLDISERKRAEFLLRAQRDLGVSLSLTSDMTVALNRLLEIAVQLGGLDCGGVYLLNQANQEIDLAVYRGVSTSFAKAVAHYSADGPEMKQLWRGPFFFTARQKLTIPLVSARLREGLRGIALLPLSHNRNIIGALALASHTSEEIPVQTRIVIEAIAAQAAGAIARIRAEAERHRLERQILDISDREQARIGQDIHDGLCQHLVSLAFDANSLRAELAVKHRPEAKKARRIADYLDEAITEARQLSRGLFPVRLEGEGLPPALEELARVTRDRFKIRCRFVCRGPVAVENSVMATHLYRIAQEAVSNAVKHSRARSVAIRLRARAGALELSIEDDGAGLSPARGKKAAGLGLHIMDYRTRTIGGTLQVGPGRRGGTVVSCCVPRPRE
jgi:PAS domain S-box-containing protein